MYIESIRSFAKNTSTPFITPNFTNFSLVQA